MKTSKVLIIKSYDHCVKSVQMRSISGPYFPVFELNTEIYLSPYSVRIRENTDQKKLRIWILFTYWIITEMHQHRIKLGQFRLTK